MDADWIRFRVWGSGLGTVFAGNLLDSSKLAPLSLNLKKFNQVQLKQMKSQNSHPNCQT